MPEPAVMDHVEHWTSTVLDLVALEEPGDHRGSHYVFCRKVLGEPRPSAMALAERFSRHALTREECEQLYADWWSCDRCRASVPGGTPLCDRCEVSHG